jgi:hypothetical protein
VKGSVENSKIGKRPNEQRSSPAVTPKSWKTARAERRLHPLYSKDPSDACVCTHKIMEKHSFLEGEKTVEVVKKTGCLCEIEDIGSHRVRNCSYLK